MESAKALIPNYIMSFIFEKFIELLDRLIRDVAQLNRPLHRDQCLYRAGMYDHEKYVLLKNRPVVEKKFP